MARPGIWSVCWCGRETEMCREMLQLTHCWHHDDDGKKGTFQVIDDVGFLSTTSRWLLSLFIVTSLTSCYCTAASLSTFIRAHMVAADLILRSIFTMGLWAYGTSEKKY